jgi:uncharacterized protein YaaQ
VVAAQRENLRAQRARLAALRRDGVLSDSIYEELVAEIDFGLQEGLEDWAARTLERRESARIRQVLFAIVQHQDLELASNALAGRGISVTRIQSRGGFLGRANHLLLVGVPEGRLEAALDVLARTCRSRVEYVPGPFETLPGTPPAPVPVEVKGATTFALDVERYEEYSP